jgi:hypothetical protein
VARVAFIRETCIQDDLSTISYVQNLMKAPPGFFQASTLFSFPVLVLLSTSSKKMRTKQGARRPDD